MKKKLTTIFQLLYTRLTFLDQVKIHQQWAHCGQMKKEKTTIAFLVVQDIIHNNPGLLAIGNITFWVWIAQN